MKILFDHQCFAVNKYNGVSRYFAELFPLFLEQGVELDLPFTLTQSVYLHQLQLKRFVALPDFVDGRVVRRVNRYAGRAQCARELRWGTYDLVHPTQYDPYVFKYAHRPVVVTVHDMVHERFQGTEFALPNFDKEISNKRESIFRSDRIIAVSENTKLDILHFYPEVPPEKIQVIYHGYRPATQPLASSEKLSGRYILYVGKRWGYKNFTNFAQAVSVLLKEDRELSLVCTGQGFNAEERQLLAKLGIEGQCRSFFLSEEELRCAYRNALVFVYPSMYEGFGQPILEAFSQNCPVCLSNTSCFSEIAGDAATYFDPADVEFMWTTIAETIHNEALRADLIERGKERLGHFSWEKSAQEHFRLYQSLL
ncbi:MAG: glycosyltransferase family 4 protein [Bacteroidales bacterium]|nr:glycosyltransferase family 4 protein [Bacteroidales bacterium]